MYKRLPILFLFCVSAFASFAQTYNNGWIDFSKTYYKFKLGPFGYDVVGAPVKAGVVRIPESALSAAGLGAVPADQFQLWRNGQEVPIYTSVSSGTLGSSDYLEFWGVINDGLPDSLLYPNSSMQLSSYWSLQSDTVSYFLTVNPAGPNKRLVSTVNNTAGATIQPDKNFRYTIGRYFRSQINPGYAVVSTENLYSSTYDMGEGWSSRAVHPDNCGCTQQYLPQGFANIYADTSGASMTAHFKILGNANNDRNVNIIFNGSQISSYDSVNYFTTATINVPGLPATMITGDAASFYIHDSSANNQDEMKVAEVTLDYPRLFNFGNATSFEFYLDPSDTGRYIRISNFSAGSATPVLYDLSNGKRYMGDVTVPGLVSFLLDPSTVKYHLVLVRSDGSTAQVFNTLTTKKFTNFADTTNQGNYLIISNPLIYGSGSENYVEQYRAYRSTAAGGGYQAKIYDINELVDQFSYGIPKDPLSVKLFLKYARNKFAVSPAYVFLIGKGLSYNAYRMNAGALADELDLVPTWGYPGSDNLLSSDDYTAIPGTPIGRLSAVSAAEVGVYLQKVKEYEAFQKDSTQTIQNKSWTKNVFQLVGADDPSTGVILDGYMKNYKSIISDSLFGGNVISYSKTADPAGYPQAIVNFENNFNQGSALLCYFGHSSSTGLDFNLDNPANYSNTGKYPMFIANGCLAGNIFDYDVNRLNARSTISEKFVLEPEKGAIGYLATTSFAVTDYLDIFTQKFYAAIARDAYGEGFGDITKYAIAQGLSVTGLSDYYGKIHAEQYTYHGDPAIKIYTSSRPDYATDSTQLSVNPGYLTVADDSFSVKVNLYNLGKAVNDSVHFTLTREYPDGSSRVVYAAEMGPILYKDSLLIELPIIADKDRGINYLIADINDDHAIAEISDSNNIAKIAFTIADADIRPIYPFDFSIVSADSVALYASTTDPMATTRKYILEMDTTALFNSPALVTRLQTSSGGVLKFDSLALGPDSTVYYWRVAQDTASPHWNGFSFTHYKLAGTGFAQAHFYQHTQSSYNGLVLDSSSRQTAFLTSLTNLFVVQSIYPTSGLEDGDFSVAENGSTITASACVGGSVIFNVFDTLALKPWVNTSNPFGAASACLPNRADNFEYSTQTRASRDSAVKFLDSIPNGDFVLVRKIFDLGNTDWAPTVWAGDTIAYGHNNSLYHRLKSQGVQIDSFNYPRTFIFLFRKNDSTQFTPISVLSQGLYDKINLGENISSSDTTGYVTSPLFGPAKSWSSVMWNGFSLNGNDHENLDVIGVGKDQQQTVLYSLQKNQTSFDISSIDTASYPYLRLGMRTEDSLTARPYQLKQWSVQYHPVPEGGLAPNLGISIPDTLSFNHAPNISYDTLSGYVVFENVSRDSFSALNLSLVLYDSLNHPYSFTLLPTAILPARDTLHLSFGIDVRTLPEGLYNLVLTVNPGQNQPEQFSFNNVLYKYVFLKRNSLLAVNTVPNLVLTATPEASAVHCKWTVLNETATRSYVLEYSTDARNFVPLGNLPVQPGNSNLKTYSLLHTHPVTGKNYYRVRVIATDGTERFSAIREVDFNHSLMEAYPNPFTNQLTIYVSSGGSATASVRIYDYSGQLVQQKTFTGSLTLDVSQLASGNYVVIVEDGTRTQTFKLQKQK